MRLTKANTQKRNDKKTLNKNKTIIDEKTNVKYKMENTFLQDKIKKYNQNLLKEKKKDKNLKGGEKHYQSNTNIYKNTSKLVNKINAQMGKNLDRNNNIYSKNKTISLNTNNNINIGNNINIITNNHIHEHNNNDDINNNIDNNNKETQLHKDFINKRGILTDYNFVKKDNINELYNKQLNENNRISRINEPIGYQSRRIRNKNVSMENRPRKFNKEIVMSDGEILTEEDNLELRRNHIYSHPYNYNSPTTFYNNDNFQNKYDQNFTNKNIYNYNKEYENFDEGGETFYNKFYKLKYTKQSYNNNVNNRNNYNSLVNDKIIKYNYTNDVQNKISNSFYIHKSPINKHKIVNNNLITNREDSQDYDNDDDNIYSNYLNFIHNKRRNQNIRRPKGKNHSMIEEADFLSPYRNYLNTNNNNVENNKYNPDVNHSIRRSKNRVKIVKKNNNSSIQEFNLSVAGDNDTDTYRNEFILEDIRKSYNLRDKNDLNNNNNHFSGILQPIKSSQFNINSNNSKINIINDYYNSNTNNRNNIKKENTLSNNNIISNSKSSQVLVSTPNFSDNGKTPKRPAIISNQKIISLNYDPNIDINNSNSINNNNNEDKNSQYKIIVKKKPKNDIPVPTNSVKRKNSSSSLNKNLNKNINNNLEICINDRINYYPEDKYLGNKKNDENKFIFDNENEITDYIFNKFEEERKKKSYFNRKLRFTGFVLSKKYKGKNLYDIRIEDDIDKINQQLKDEQIFINDKKVEFRFIDDNNKQNNNNNENENVNENNNKINADLLEENKLLKLEIEKNNKKDIVKNELITKLDNEKQKYIQEIEQLKEEIKNLKDMNNQLTINKNNNKTNYKIENNLLFTINKSNNKKINEEKLFKGNDNFEEDNKDISNINPVSSVDMVNYLNENTDNEKKKNNNNNQNLLN